MIRTVRSRVILALAMPLLGCSDVSSPQEDPTAEPQTLRPCTVDGVSKPTLCGWYDVPENRAEPTGRMVRLRVVVAKALNAEPAPDPIVYFEGGPGGSSIGVAPFLTNEMPGARARRDMVFIDQRGTGASGKLTCNTALPSGEISLFGSLFPPDHVLACATRLSSQADLAQYTTPIAADDMAEVLGALGYDSVNVFGTSYGTRLALVFARRHPDMIRSVSVNGVAPPDRIAYLEGSESVESALEWGLSGCEADPTCGAEHPNVRTDFASLVARFDNGPVSTDVTLSDGSTANVMFAHADFAYAVRGMFYGNLADSLAPWTSRAVSTGGWAGFADYYVQRSKWVAGTFATGMHLSVWCAEDVPFATEAVMASYDNGALLGSSLIRRYRDACALWSTEPVPADYKQPVTIDLPVFIVSGERDPVTPATWGEALAAGLPNAVHITVPDAGHVPFGSCINSIQEAFWNSADPQGLSTSCMGG